jgi:LSD1 subclass zinc finger protein
MAIALHCPACRKLLKANDDQAGKRVRCPGCQAVLTIPGPAGQITRAAPIPKAAPAGPPATTPLPPTARQMPGLRPSQPVDNS